MTSELFEDSESALRQIGSSTVQVLQLGRGGAGRDGIPESFTFLQDGARARLRKNSLKNVVFLFSQLAPLLRIKMAAH